MNELEQKIYKEVKKRCQAPTNVYGIGAWSHHIKLVYDLAKKNAKMYNANQEIVALAALLHDIASVTDEKLTENHHIYGARIAENLLTKENYPNEKIELIKKCILHHRASVIFPTTTNEEICIKDADAMAHFYSIPSLLSMVYREKQLSIDEGKKFVLNKLERSYNKLTEKGKKLVQKQYDAAKLLLK